MKRVKFSIVACLFLFPMISFAAGDSVVALDNRDAPIAAGKLLETGTESTNFVDKSNMRIKLAPFSVAEFSANGEFKLLRGSAMLESDSESHMSTAGAGVNFVGKLLISFDHKERSTSTFVMQGQARLENPFQADHTVIVDKNHGATMVVGDVYPTLLRQLDVPSLDSWLAGYKWSKADRETVTKNYAGMMAGEKPKSKEQVSLQDYYGTLNVREERPEYYQNKFSDPDKVMAEAAEKKTKPKELTPEEAALISLPNTKLDTEMGIPLEFLSAKDRQAEILKRPDENKPVVEPTRKIASVTKPRRAKAAVAQKSVVTGDPEVNTVVDRLRALQSNNKQMPNALEMGREPASESGVPDPVYDFSQNF